jgi:hypothetical protein
VNLGHRSSSTSGKNFYRLPFTPPLWSPNRPFTLPEEAIFNQNKAATEKRRAARKAQHKEREIAKRDRNDNHIKRRKAGERGVSSNEDPLSEPSWSGDMASAVVDRSDMSESSSS